MIWLNVLALACTCFSAGASLMTGQLGWMVFNLALAAFNAYIVVSRL